MLTKSFTTIAGYKIAYLSNSEATPQLLCLHGWYNNKYSYAPVLDLLNAKLSIVAIDMPGFGESEAPNMFAIDSYLDNLATVMKTLAPRAHLMGTSMGASFALLLASRYPDLCQKLILRTPYITFSDLKVPYPFRTGLFKIAATRTGLLYLNSIFNYLQTQKVRTSASHEFFRYYPEWLEINKPKQPDTARATLEYLFQQDLTPALRTNSKETLMILAKRDAFFTNSTLETFKNQNYTLAYTDQHNMVTENYSKFAKKLIHFLNLDL